MNPETVDSEYQKLQDQSQAAIGSVQQLASKLQAAASAGNADAREWLLDLKSIAISIQQEQLQAQSLLQAIHDMTVDHLASPQYQQAQPAYAAPQQYAPQYAPQPSYQPMPAQGGGFLGRFMGGGFGRAIATGAGFAVGDDIINSIF